VRVIREWRDEDVPGLVRLYDEVYPQWITTVETWRHRQAELPERARQRRWVALEEGEVVGTASSGLQAYSATEGHASIYAAVAPSRRRRGIGKELFAVAEEHVLSLEPRLLESGSIEDEESQRFLAARGFRRTRTERVSAVDPAAVDLEPFRRLREAKEREGFELAPLSRWRDDPEPIYVLDLAATEDMPMDEPIGDVPLEEWIGTYWNHPLLTLDGSFVAAYEGRPVSLAMVQADLASGKAANEMTGTLREFRGRSLARLVKLASLEWAARNGIRLVVTGNDATNAPMLAINDSLGYRPFAAELAWMRG
jgi:GNAT superfamily N-acetyltransferase